MTRVTTVTVTSEGSKIDPSYSLISLEINQQINKLASAEITYFDSKGYVGNFDISEDQVFKPGNKVKIQVRYEGTGSSDHTVFEGIIVGHKIKFNKKGSLVILELKHHAILLTRTRNNLIYLNQTDKDIFNQVVKNYSDVKFSSKVKGGIKHTQMVQYNCTDWDFMLSRAEANGWWLLAANAELAVNEPETSTVKYVLDLAADSKIYDLEIGLDVSYQTASIEAVTWKVDNQEIITETSKAEQGAKLGTQVDPFKKVLKGEGKLSHIGNLTKEELKIWTQAKLAKNDFSLLRGRIKTEGLPEIMIGMTIELKSLTKYFNGKHIVSRVHHSIGANGFQTEIGIGLSSEGLIKSEEVQAPLAGGLLPSVSGLQIGVVEAYEEKPESKLLVKVKLPLFEGKSKSVMARLASIYAGKERGVVFRPEIGDEVVLGFFNDDPRYPVVLGSMYSAKNKPPVDFTKDNDIKAIITREKLTLSLDEKTKVISIQSGEDNKISIASGDKPGVEIIDKNKNNLSLNDKGISATSKKELVVKADKSVTIQGQKVEIK